MRLPLRHCSGPLLLGITFSAVLLCVHCKKAPGTASGKPGTPHRWRLLGAWSQWSLWSECTRSCGGGVSMQTRDCVAGIRHSGKHMRTRHSNNGTKTHCLGTHKRHQLCNSTPCDNKKPGDFRLEQCAGFNKKPFSGKFYKWEPFFQANNLCALNCRALGFRFYATLSQQVVDGTPCDEEAKPDRICVFGECKQIGCDGIIGSGKQLDKCGICGGNNSSCKTITGLFMNPDLPDGYNHIASIPLGACNINITEMKHSKNHLALRQLDGDYIINGNWAINWPGDYPAVGTVFTYQRDDSSDQMTECITAKGPTNEPLDIMMIFKQQNPGIRYEYALPISNQLPKSPRLFPPTIDSNHFSADALTRSHTALMTPLSDTPTKVSSFNKTSHNSSRPRKTDPTRLRSRARHYAWQESGFSECSKSCAEGFQSTLYVCVKTSSGIVVNDVNCETIPKPPPRTEKCNTWPCPPQWIPGDWSECSATCGHGIQTREFKCMQQIKVNLQVPVAEALCTLRSSEHRRRSCHVRSCAFWRTGKWSQCSTECGKGMRSRQVYCVGGDNAPLAENYCELSSRPSAEEICDMGSCAKTWFFTEWSSYQCTHKCGSGIQTRKLYCPVGNEGGCDNSQRPIEIQACPGGSKCPAQWFQGPWSQCSVSCGTGSQVRDVICVVPSRGQFRLVKDGTCIEAEKPTTKQQCIMKSCEAEWYISDWTQCTKTCDTGTQTREVKCLDENQQSSLACPLNLRPLTRQACATEDCLIHGSQGDAGCTDKFKKCHLVAQSRLCSYPYYQDGCCQSCAKFVH